VNFFFVSCNFGDYPDQSMCEWRSSDDGALQWQVGIGKTSNWLGGPTNDFSTGETGGKSIFYIPLVFFSKAK